MLSVVSMPLKHHYEASTLFLFDFLKITAKIMKANAH